MLYIQKFETKGINSHLQAYEILNVTYSNTLVNISFLCNKHTFCAHTYIGNGQLYIVSKNYDVVRILH